MLLKNEELPYLRNLVSGVSVDKVKFAKDEDKYSKVFDAVKSNAFLSSSKGKTVYGTKLVYTGFEGCTNTGYILKGEYISDIPNTFRVCGFDFDNDLNMYIVGNNRKTALDLKLNFLTCITNGELKDLKDIISIKLLKYVLMQIKVGEQVTREGVLGIVGGESNPSVIIRILGGVSSDMSKVVQLFSSTYVNDLIKDMISVSTSVRVCLMQLGTYFSYMVNNVGLIDSLDVSSSFVAYDSILKGVGYLMDFSVGEGFNVIKFFEKTSKLPLDATYYSSETVNYDYSVVEKLGSPALVNALNSAEMVQLNNPDLDLSYVKKLKGSDAGVVESGLKGLVKKLDVATKTEISSPVGKDVKGSEDLISKVKEESVAVKESNVFVDSSKLVYKFTADLLKMFKSV